MTTTVTSERINAAPGTVYELIADLPQQGRFTRECERVDWLDGADRPAVGARFRGHNRKGRARWSTIGQVTAVEPGRVLAYRIMMSIGIPIADWRYEVRPDGSGCVVEESTIDRRPKWFAVFTALIGISALDRSEHNRRNMTKTLAGLKELAES